MREGVAVRVAHAGDAAELLPLLSEVGPSHDTAEAVRSALESVEREPTSCVYVAEAGGRVVGFGFAYVHLIETFVRPGRWARLASMAVDRSFRRAGVGSALVDAVEKYATSMGCESIELTSAPQRHDAHAFYRRCGYEPAVSRWLAKPLDPRRVAE